MSSDIRAEDERGCPAGLIKAQALARRVVRAVGARLHVGVTEIELARTAERLARNYGASGVWTPVTTRVGLGTLVAHPEFPMQERVLREGDTVIVDVTPIVDGWLGDYCESFVLGEDEKQVELLADCRCVQRSLIDAMAPGMPANELYAVAGDLLAQRDLKLLDLLDNVGHSIGRRFAVDGFIDASNVTPMYGAWTVEPHVGRRARGAKYEDVVWLDTDGSKGVIS